MKTFLAISLAGVCSAASAQTPATNPMPDGSRDMYVGLGIVSAPEFSGASDKRVRALPLLQVELSNGIFISGMNAGMHLSNQPSLEFGPLLSLHSGRSESGDRGRLGGVTETASPPGLVADPGNMVSIGPDGRNPSRFRLAPNGLDGMNDVKARLQGGAFANYYIRPQLRLTSTLLYGAGNERDGLSASFGVQHVVAEIAPHHRVSLSAGLTMVNRSLNAALFGVTMEEAGNTGYAPYAPGGGLRDIYVGAGWNWALTPNWMLVSSARLSSLRGDARSSPLVQRPTGFTMSTGLAYRF